MPKENNNHTYEDCEPSTLFREFAAALLVSTIWFLQQERMTELLTLYGLIQIKAKSCVARIS